MSPSFTTPIEQSELFDRLATLTSDGERQEFFQDHPQLSEPDVIGQICDAVARLVRVDLHQAEHVATTALWLADHLKDHYGQARSQRAAANVLHLQGDYGAALQLYESALERFNALAHARETAITRSSALQTLAFLGQYERAAQWAAAAAEVFQELGDRLRLARLDFNFANILFRQDRWEEASARYQSAYEEFVRVGEPLDVAVSLRNMAVCQTSLNNFNRALEIYQKARGYSKEHGLARLVLELDYNIAYLHYLRGEYTRALLLYQKARLACEELRDRYHRALCDLDQAEIYLELNLVEEAAELAQQAFVSFDELGMQYETAKALTNLAIADSRQGKAFLALDLLGKAREIFVGEENHVWPALIDLYQALVLYREGRPFEAARLASGAHASFSASALLTKAAMCEILLARLHLERREHQRARQVCEAAIARLEPLDVPMLEYQAHFVLGQVEEAAGDPEAALRAYRRSHRKLERLRSHLQTEELKIAFLEDKLVVYESLVFLNLQGPLTEERKRTAFTYFEKAKSRSLADLMAFRAHALPPKSAARSDLAEQVRNLREELNWYYRQIDLQEMRGDDRSTEEVEKLRQISQRQEDDLLRTLRELQVTDQEFSSLQEGATVDLQTIRSVMPEDTTVVEYYIARGTIHACVFNRSELQIVPLTVASRARERYRLLQFQLSKFRLGNEYVRQFSHLIDEATRTHLLELYHELVAPLEDRLQSESLVFVPHGFLHHVPFHALFDGEKFLVDRYSISYAPSASVYYLCCTKETHPEDRALVLGLPDVTAPHILEEVQAVAESLPNAKLCIGQDASEGSLRIDGETSRFVHIATHGFFRQDNPMFSAIELGGSRLSLFDLYNLKLNAELVVLSGCGTGLNVVMGGDELVGLTRGLLYAGAQSVLVTLWDVHDESTSVFMRSFYEKLGRQYHKAEAARRAMQEVRELYPHPYYWAPFVLVGQPDGPCVPAGKAKS